jgi:hypothetical protein
MPNVDALLERLGNVRPNGSGRWSARCPNHQDRSSSLSVRLADDRILINCFAGCKTADVLAAVNLEFKDLFNAPERPYEFTRETEQERLEREFKRDHPNADPCFFSSWQELRSSNWQPLGAGLPQAVIKVVQGSNPPRFPATLQRLHQGAKTGQAHLWNVDGVQTPEGNLALSSLATWIADALRPLIAPNTNQAQSGRVAPRALGFDPLAKYRRKMAKLRGAR